MASSINASTSGAGGVITTADNTGILNLQTASTNAITINASQLVGVGTSSPTNSISISNPSVYAALSFDWTGDSAAKARIGANHSTGEVQYWATTNYFPTFYAGNSERMRIDSSGQVIVGKTVNTFGTQGAVLNAENAFYNTFTRSGGSVISVNRTTNDGTLVEFAQDGTVEGTISVSGTTVSYNGGHLSRWSQLYNETTKVNVYRGTVLESVDAMCVWEKDGQPLPNEQATKTIVSTTPSSKAVAGVFDRYDEDDQNNPYDFYVAQSGDFVIRIAQDVTVQNGDLLESAGDGTARPQADDICRSSTIAKVTSNYVSATYEDGSYCVPCILMIG